jgi:hypothetical protein
VGGEGYPIVVVNISFVVVLCVLRRAILQLGIIRVSTQLHNSRLEVAGDDKQDKNSAPSMVMESSNANTTQTSHARIECWPLLPEGREE